MKRIFRFYNYEHRCYLSEKDCRKELGDEKFDAMLSEAIRTMDQRNSAECDFLESITTGEVSPYADWCVEERTRYILDDILVLIYTIAVVAARAIVYAIWGSAEWSKYLFEGIGWATIILGLGIYIPEMNGWQWRDTPALTLILSGSVIVASVIAPAMYAGI